MNKNLIYALKDPETKEIRYIGKSTTGLRRPNQHKLKHSLIAQTHKNNWIKTLLEKGLVYEIIVLEENLDSVVLDSKEITWIAHYKALGASLTNGTEGGEGSLGRTLSDASRKVIGEKMSNWFKTHGPTDKMKEISYKKKEYNNIGGINHKHCWKCNEYKPLTEYGNYSSSWDKLAAECKTCHNLIAKSYRDSHPIIKLTEKELEQSYVDRKDAMVAGLKEAYKNPELCKQNAIKASKPILQCDLNGRVIKEFSSALEAKKAGFQNSNVGQAIKYKKPYRGFTWKFKNKE